jgi:hypothetical protein
MAEHSKQTTPLQRGRQTKNSGRWAHAFKFVGSDSAHSDLDSLDGSRKLTYAEKFERICQLSLFAYQLKNNTEHVPRLLRTTACIRKA